MPFRFPNMHDKMMNNGNVLRWEEKWFWIKKKPDAVFTSLPSRLFIMYIFDWNSFDHFAFTFRYWQVRQYCFFFFRLGSPHCGVQSYDEGQIAFFFEMVPFIPHDFGRRRRSISITILWIYFLSILGNSNAIFTSAVQNVDLKYNLSKWKYIIDEVRVRHLPTFFIDFAAPQTFSIICPISIPVEGNILSIKRFDCTYVMTFRFIHQYTIEIWHYATATEK